MQPIWEYHPVALFGEQADLLHLAKLGKDILEFRVANALFYTTNVDGSVGHGKIWEASNFVVRLGGNVSLSTVGPAKPDRSALEFVAAVPVFDGALRRGFYSEVDESIRNRW